MPGSCSGCPNTGRMMFQFEQAGNGESLENSVFTCVDLYSEHAEKSGLMDCPRRDRITAASMENSTVAADLVRFEDFELDLRSYQVRRSGLALKLERIPMEVLFLLVERPGQLVTREEIIEKLWGKNAFLDTDNAINTAIRKIRQVLKDDPEQPRLIQTVTGRGYRFIGQSQVVAPPANAPIQDKPASSSSPKAATFAAPITAGAATGAPTGIRGRWKLIVPAIVAVLASSVGGYFYIRRTPKLTDKDTIVLADFINTTGDSVFDGTLRQGLAVQLEQSPFLSLISEERIQQVLRLMGKPADARLTPEIAREICERTASAAVLDGSIASLGSQYVLTLRAKDCRTGDVLDEEQVQPARKEDVLNTLSQIASRFRTRVGESLSTVKSHDTPLAEATTPSLEALKAYSAGWQVSFSSGSAASVPFFQRAVEIDRTFASAYAALGRMYGDIGESVLSAVNTSKAYELRDRASDQEKFFISLSYDLQVTGNLEKGQQTCALWVQAYPRAWVPHGLLSGDIYVVRGKREESVEEGKAALAIDPDFSIGYANLAVSYMALERLDEAENTLRRASERKLEIPDFLVLRYVIAFLKGDKVGMEREVALTREQPGPDDWMSNSEGFVLAYSGHLEAARKWSQRAADLAGKTARRDTEALYEADAAVREALFGNASPARERAVHALELSKSRDVAYGVGFALALSGDSSRSQALTEDLSRRLPEDTRVQFTYAPTLRALLALNHRQPSKAVELLQTTIAYELGSPTIGGSEFFLGAGNLYSAYVRGLAYLAAHHGVEAAGEFQKILDHRGIVISDPIGALAHLQLGRAYAMSGDKTKAKSAYQDFLALWKDADPDIAVLKQAQAEYANFN
jgi:DNA-binding winged helix-turn-helix (wHTH) protein/tetratricopeptide (TPR) repeat protein